MHLEEDRKAISGKAMSRRNDKSGELPEIVRKYLKSCGLRNNRINRCTLETRLYHDLDIYGDEAEGYMDALVNLYHVDLTDFVFEKYFPPEFIGRNVLERTLIHAVPFVGHYLRRKLSLCPVTLAMIERSIKEKSWVDTGNNLGGDIEDI